MMERAGQLKNGASHTYSEPRDPELHCHPTPAQAMRRTESAGWSEVCGSLPEPFCYRLCLGWALDVISMSD